MFNAPFQIDVRATAPFAYEKNEEAYTGITVVGTVRTKDMDFLNDLEMGEKKDGLRRILSGELPTRQSVKLAYTAPTDLRLRFPGTGELGCELSEVETGALNDEGLMVIDMKLKMKDVDASEAGEIVSQLRQVVAVTLVTTQLKLL